LLRCEAYNERTGFVLLKGKILFLSNSVQPKEMSTRGEGQALCEPAWVWSRRLADPRNRRRAWALPLYHKVTA